MPATLVAINEEHRSPKAREEKLRANVSKAFNAMIEECNKYEQADSKVLREMFFEYVRAEDTVGTYWKRRADAAERGLRRVLGTDLTDEQRADVLSVLRVDRGHDRSLLSPYEAQLIQQYRGMDPAGCQMIRTLFSRLTETSQSEKGGS